MKKAMLLLILILLGSVFTVAEVKAIDSPTGNVTGSYSYGDGNLVDVDVSLYLIANINTSSGLEYNYLDDFEGEKVDYSKISATELEEHSKDLYSIISKNGIEPIAETKTDQFGNFWFNDLAEGLYMIKAADTKYNNKLYRSLPTLVFIPSDISGNIYNYNISVNIKAEVVNLNTADNNVNQNSGSDINTPNTYDAIIKYIVLFIISAILLVVLSYYMYISNNKKGNEKYEKNE